MSYLALDIAATGMQSNQTNVDVISGNLANMNTIGYKEASANFQDLMYINYAAGGSVNSSSGIQIPTTSQIGLGSRLASISKNFQQGEPEATPGRALNISIRGEGFFEVTLPDGTTAYTRDGSFTRSSTGEIVTASGYTVQPSITIPDGAADITITPDGTINALLPGSTLISELGQIELARFLNNSGLQSIGDNLYVETTASGTPTTGTADQSGFGRVLQFSLELSNVNSISQVVALIKAQRSFEYCSNCLKTAAQMSKTEIDSSV